MNDSSMAMGNATGWFTSWFWLAGLPSRQFESALFPQ